ncbi:hypothetical protein ANN_19027 [Periplaneta americana]|uniref:Uncharacterized protein n=1 Tax=Periplaneta americana TaxID=6978 RepID=A0ABQ8SSI3_PERAM|nr:hypothetical protein ANN_19027 [Periplaneta americana]
MDLREVGYDDRDWTNLARDRSRWRAYVRSPVYPFPFTTFVGQVRDPPANYLYSSKLTRGLCELLLQSSEFELDAMTRLSPRPLARGVHAGLPADRSDSFTVNSEPVSKTT